MEQPAVFLSCGSERRYSARLCRERLVWPGLDGCWLGLGSVVRKLHFYARKWSPLQPIWLGILLTAWGVPRAHNCWQRLPSSLRAGICARLCASQRFLWAGGPAASADGRTASRSHGTTGIWRVSCGRIQTANRLNTLINGTAKAALLLFLGKAQT